jgi:hypothetical protein
MRITQRSFIGETVDVGNVVDNVTYILEQYPDTRNSYKRLLVRYWLEFDGLDEILGPEVCEAFLTWFTKRATSPKTLQNRVGEVQNARPDLEACPDVADWRLRQARAGVVK